MKRLFLLSLAVVSSLYFGFRPGQAVEPPVVPPPTNGLAGDERDRWRHLSQGSELYPYRFLKALYIVADQKPFIQNLDRFGFIPDPVSEANPEGVPIGMTVSVTKDLSFAGVRMMGINCAACHTTVLEKDGKIVAKIDGGQSLFDIRGFLRALAVNTEATFKSDGELLRFTGRLLADLADDPSPQTFTTRIVAKGGERLLADVGKVEDFANRGPVEKQLVEDVAQLIRDELKKPVVPLQETLRTMDKHPDLADYAQNVDKTFGTIKPDAPIAKSPLAIAKAALAVRRRIHGDLLSGIQDFKQLAAVAPGEGSPLRLLEEEARRVELRTGFGNVLDTLRLLRARADFLASLANSNAGNPKFLPLRGRIDAFGAARNAMFPDSMIAQTAPVSFPHLWNVKEIPQYHYDNNTTSELERNVGEAIGVGVIYTKQYDSTVRIDNIKELERLAGKIAPPVWPTAAFGVPDQIKVARGEVLYKATCVKCHQEYVPGTKLDDKSYPLAQIKTDELRAKNFAIPMKDGRTFVENLSPLLKKIINANGGVADDVMHWRTTRMYGARPLSGIWASPPYLHNGSVASIYELLLEPKDRLPSFQVGIREFDPKNLGYVTKGDPTIYPALDTTLEGYGNSNKGHSGEDYGTTWTDEQRYDLIEYLKTK